MVPNYSEKAKFGKVPGYLKKFKNDKAMEQARWEEEQEELMRRREKMKLQDHERHELLEVDKSLFMELFKKNSMVYLIHELIPPGSEGKLVSFASYLSGKILTIRNPRWLIS